MKDIELKTVNSVRVISAEAIEKAKSGHPGMCLGAAPIGVSIFTNMVFNPKNPKFFNRDRFVLSAGHASMLIYSLLHLFGYKVSMEDIKNFRQLGSITTGHPEYDLCPGVEVSTGPLGQGIANAVGMAIAETMTAERFNKEGYKICDHYTYALSGDGCFEEGIENEAASLAGTLKLGKLIVFYDNNNITIEGNTSIDFSEDVGKRHEALGWQVLKVNDANDLNALNKAIKKAKAETEKPSLIIVKSEIGFGSPLVNSEKCHGSPLGEENLQALKNNLGWTNPPFTVSPEVYSYCKKFANKGKRIEKAYKEMLEQYKGKYPEEYKEFIAFTERELPDLIGDEDLWAFEKDDASRGYSNTVLNKLAKKINGIVGGSADLAPANKSYMKDLGDYSPLDRTGRNIHFGIREHAMGAIANGIYLHGGFIPYVATFAVFSDYMKNAIRMAGLMKLPVFYIFSHDSIGVGEDGPTHQPIEQLSSLRLTPNVNVFRPADGKETTAGYITALTSDNPTALFVSRQTLPRLEGSKKDALKGGYVLSDSKKIDAIIIATGSEVALALSAKEELEKDGIGVRVVSMPCVELFMKQPKKYRESVLPAKITKRLAIEAGAKDYWYKFVGLDGDVLGIDTFGTSAPYNKVFEKYGFTTDNAVAKVKALLEK